MDDQALVRELHGVAHREKDREPLVDPEPLLVAVRRGAACPRRTP